MNAIEINRLRYNFSRDKAKLLIILLLVVLMMLGLDLWVRITDMRGDKNYST